MTTRYEFEAEVWRWEARTEEWALARLPADISAEIAEQPRPRAGFGSVRVNVTLGSSRWTTSIFPEANGCYVVPLKASVRSHEGVKLGDVVTLGIEPLI